MAWATPGPLLGQEFATASLPARKRWSVPLEPRRLNAYTVHADNEMRVERALGQAIMAAWQT
ncbi:MAG: hypothetical protein R3E79_45975 [Caldilineaceae bacterium]